MTYLILIFLLSSNWALETIDQFGHKVMLFKEQEIDTLLEQTGEQALMQIHNGINEKNLQKLLKIFTLQFIPIKDPSENDTLDGVTIYSAGKKSLKLNMKKFFSSDVNPQEIASYLLEITENRIRPINKHTFQNELISSLSYQKKYPVILFENTEQKNNLLSFRSLPFDSKLKENFEFFFFDDDPMVLSEQIQFQKFPSMIVFNLTPVPGNEEQQAIGGSPFQGILNYKNMIQFLYSFLYENKKSVFGQEEPKEQEVKLDNSINLFTTKHDQTLKNCDKKKCVLVFVKKEFENKEIIDNVIDVLQNVQSFFNKQATEIYLLDGGCYYDKLIDLGLSWDSLPGLIIYDKSNKSIYQLQDKFDKNGIKRGILKSEKNLIPKTQLDDFIVLESKDCEEENKRLKKRLEKLNKVEVDDWEDELMKEVIQQSKEREKEKETVPLSKKEKRRLRREERRKREQNEDLQLIIMIGINMIGMQEIFKSKNFNKDSLGECFLNLDTFVSNLNTVQISIQEQEEQIDCLKELLSNIWKDLIQLNLSEEQTNIILETFEELFIDSVIHQTTIEENFQKFKKRILLYACNQIWIIQKKFNQSEIESIFASFYQNFFKLMRIYQEVFGTRKNKILIINRNDSSITSLRKQVEHESQEYQETLKEFQEDLQQEILKKYKDVIKENN